MCIVTIKYILKLHVPKQHNQRMATRLDCTYLYQNYETVEGLSMPIMKYINMYRKHLNSPLV